MKSPPPNRVDPPESGKHVGAIIAARTGAKLIDNRDGGSG